MQDSPKTCQVQAPLYRSQHLPGQRKRWLNPMAKQARRWDLATVCQVPGTACYPSVMLWGQCIVAGLDRSLWIRAWGSRNLGEDIPVPLHCSQAVHTSSIPSSNIWGQLCNCDREVLVDQDYQKVSQFRNPNIWMVSSLWRHLPLWQCRITIDMMQRCVINSRYHLSKSPSEHSPTHRLIAESSYWTAVRHMLLYFQRPYLPLSMHTSCCRLHYSGCTCVSLSFKLYLCCHV